MKALCRYLATHVNGSRLPQPGTTCRCSHIAPVSHDRGTSRPWIYRCYKLTIISRYISTCACALSTIRVPVAGARETGGHLAGLAPMEGNHDQGERELGGLHVGFRALSDTPTLIFWYIMDILSEKVHPYREANIKRIQIKLAFVRFLLGGGVQTLACMVCGTFLPLKQ